jgi:hypothetical protein
LPLIITPMKKNRRARVQTTDRQFNLLRYFDEEHQGPIRNGLLDENVKKAEENKSAPGAPLSKRSIQHLDGSARMNKDAGFRTSEKVKNSPAKDASLYLLRESPITASAAEDDNEGFQAVSYGEESSSVFNARNHKLLHKRLLEDSTSQRSLSFTKREPSFQALEKQEAEFEAQNCVAVSFSSGGETDTSSEEDDSLNFFGADVGGSDLFIGGTESGDNIFASP